MKTKHNSSVLEISTKDLKSTRRRDESNFFRSRVCFQYIKFSIDMPVVKFHHNARNPAVFHLKLWSLALGVYPVTYGNLSSEFLAREMMLRRLIMREGCGSNALIVVEKE